MLALAPLPAAAACPVGTVTGEVTYVRDGDTIELGALAIRLDGLAAPEWNAPGGQEATGAMKALVLGKSVTCELDGEGATVEQIAAATGWQKHTVRGAISGALKKKLGLKVEATRTREVGLEKTGAKGSATVYRIVG